MIKLYTNNCPRCKIIKQLMESKNIKFEIIDDESEYMKKAIEFNSYTMPFAEIDNIFYDSSSLQEYIKNYGGYNVF